MTYAHLWKHLSGSGSTSVVLQIDGVRCEAEVDVEKRVAPPDRYQLRIHISEWPTPGSFTPIPAHEFASTNPREVARRLWRARSLIELERYAIGSLRRDTRLNDEHLLAAVRNAVYLAQDAEETA